MNKPTLLGEQEVLNSSVVSNCCMNRERKLDAYCRELRFDFSKWLSSHTDQSQLRWIDFCCGTGSALIDAGCQFGTVHPGLSIEGIDLVDHFSEDKFPDNLTLVKSSIEEWTPEHKYDLVTCVHGLHYLGDKISAIAKMSQCLSDHGIFLANIDLDNFKFENGKPAGRTLTRRMRSKGFEYDRRLLKCLGPRDAINLQLEYLGADNSAGPNYTGQASINSYYRDTSCTQ